MYSRLATGIIVAGTRTPGRGGEFGKRGGEDRQDGFQVNGGDGGKGDDGEGAAKKRA